MAVKKATSRRKTATSKPRKAARPKSAAPKSKAKVTATLKINVWLDPRDGKIRVVAPGRFITTVSDQPGQRLHKHLYSKLKAVLKKRGKWFEIV